ncbi:MAG: class B sortase, partial [Lachnospiraceae bacterium]|nr:class B sortase [Lachnospiraceae bacterium]
RSADAHNYQVSQNITVAPVPEEPEITEEPEETEEAEEKVEITYPYLNIDHYNLSKINSDYVGTIFVPVLDICYPVVHSHDDEEYLKIMFDGTQNASGSIFMSKACKAEYSSRNTIIFGHNMRNGTMFGSLKRFRKEEGLVDQNPYVYIYTPGGDVKKYRIFAYYPAYQPDVCYDEISSFDLYDQYLDMVFERSEYELSEDLKNTLFEGYPNILTLSTCGRSNGASFNVVNAVYVGTGNTPIEVTEE